MTEVSGKILMVTAMVTMLTAPELTCSLTILANGTILTETDTETTETGLLLMEHNGLTTIAMAMATTQAELTETSTLTIH